MKIFRTSFSKKLMMCFVINFMFTTCFPFGVFALTSGTNSPEFSSFTPVSSNNMVNTFTGDFNYNIPVIEIPGPHGGGYAMSLSYNGSVISGEKESSWVGFGWTLNPGAITRNTRGFPDEYNGNEIKYYNKNRPSWTATSSNFVGLELFSNDTPLGISAGKTNRFNNYTGYYKITNIGLNWKGIGLNVSLSPNGTTFSPTLSPLQLISSNNSEREDDRKTLESAEKDGIDTKFNKDYFKPENLVKSAVTNYQISLYNEAVKPTFISESKGFAANWSFGLQVTPGPVPIGIQTGISGNFNLRYNKILNNANAYGYLNTPNSSDENVMMDYYVEKGSMFKERDIFIGMPFNNHDIFSVAGEGLQGGFRAYLNSTGSYGPNHITNSFGVGQAGFEVALGMEIGAGLRIGLGYHQTKIDSWEYTSGSKGNFSNDAVFRFEGDMADEMNLKSLKNDAKVSSDAEYTPLVTPVNIPIFMKRNINGKGGVGLEPISSSSHISEKYGSSGLDGFDIYNKSGVRYQYNKPLRVRNESSISIDVNEDDYIQNRYLAFKELKLKNSGNGDYTASVEDLQTSHHRIFTGQIDNNTYSKSYLLTEILSPNYVDVTNNGVSHDDFGGWTKFTYRDIYGPSNDSWYRYRAPYNGLLYNQNSISDTKDDIGSVTTGEKEVSYLGRVETKTHVAFFVTNKSDFSENTLNERQNEFLTGSNIERKDGLSAPKLSSTDDPAAANGNVHGDEDLEYLEKIVLFSRNNNGELSSNPIKVVRFEYDYSLVPNVPNNSSSNFDYMNSTNSVNSNTGKLTLRKMWFEHGGVIPAKISPYEFGYNYPKSSDLKKGGEYFEAYDHLTENYQNPKYQPYSLDSWGNTMINGEKRKENQIPWIDQGAYYEDELIEFDPAAYHLKTIKLPSGATFHIQYEQKDYKFVQDEQAMVMANIEGSKNTGLANFNSYESNPSYIIDAKDLGINPENLDELYYAKDMINQHFNSTSGEEVKNKIYFKFLYALVGNNPSLDNCKSDYVTGYSNFDNAEIVEIDGENKIQITLSGEGTNNGERALVPREAGYEFAVNQRQGKLNSSDCIDPFLEAKYDEVITESVYDYSGDFTPFLTFTVGVSLLKDLAFSSFYNQNGSYGNIAGNLKRADVCASMNNELSFLKLPMFKAKKGGGVRVKRLLMSGSSLEEGDDYIYGKEYFYELEDGTSSGVATNEPPGNREENPLVNFMPRENQKWLNRLISGEDREQSEGPLGESILPAATVGHSRVIEQNIHTGKTGTGHTIHEFFTAKDAPVTKTYSRRDLSKYDFSGKATERTNLNKPEEDRFNINMGVVNFGIDKIWATQGFRFIQNSIHGTTKKISQYASKYISGIPSEVIVSYKEYDYYEVGEKVEMWGFDNTGKLKVERKSPGKTIDFTQESRRVKDFSLDLSIELDIGVGAVPVPTIFVSLFPSLTQLNSMVANHSNTKVISYPTVLKKVSSFSEGVYAEQEFLAFNKQTGSPVLTKFNDSYTKGDIIKDNIFELNIPASWVYEGMGAKSENESSSNQLNATTAKYLVYNTKPDAEWFNNPVNLIETSINTFSNDWTSSWDDQKVKERYNLSDNSDLISKLNGIWRNESSYIYKSESVNGTEDTNQQGMFDISQPFSWDNLDELGASWIKTNEIQLYSPHGDVLEDKNVLDISSAAFYSAELTVNAPVMVTQNATYDNIYFNSYESSGNDRANKSHSGYQSKVLSSADDLSDGQIIIDNQIMQEGALAFFWLNKKDNNLLMEIEGTSIAPTLKTQVGNWYLYKTSIDKNVFTNSTIGNPITINVNSSESGEILVDDFKFQPMESSSTCFVFDLDNFRLLTKFDNQHFGMYYQYDQKGKLIRKIIETERGKKSLQETFYNTPRTERAGE